MDRTQGELTWIFVVADCEERGNITCHVCQTGRRAILCITGNGGGVLPHKLGEMAPMLKVGHIRIGLTVETGKPIDLTVVKQIADDGSNVVFCDTCSNVLPITTAASSPETESVMLNILIDSKYLHVMSVNASFCNRLSL